MSSLHSFYLLIIVVKHKPHLLFDILKFALVSCVNLWWSSEERGHCTILQQMVKCSNSCRNSLTRTVSDRRRDIELLCVQLWMKLFHTRMHRSVKCNLSPSSIHFFVREHVFALKSRLNRFHAAEKSSRSSSLMLFSDN